MSDKPTKVYYTHPNTGQYDPHRKVIRMSGDALDSAHDRSATPMLDRLEQQNANMAECVKQIVRDEYMSGDKEEE